MDMIYSLDMKKKTLENLENLVPWSKHEKLQNTRNWSASLITLTLFIEGIKLKNI